MNPQTDPPADGPDGAAPVGADLSTRTGYRAFLETNGNSPAMIAELLRTYFPEPSPRIPVTRRRRPQPAGQLALDLPAA